MKIRIATKDNIIRIPDNFATLVGIDKQGRYRYRIRYDINVENALNSNVRFVKILFKQSVPSEQVTKIFDGNVDAKSIKEKILRQNSNQSTLKEANASLIFKTINSDYTKKVDLSLLGTAVERKGDLQLEQEEEDPTETSRLDGTRENYFKYARRIRRTRPIRVDSLRQDGRRLPVLLQNKAQLYNSSSMPDKTLNHTIFGREALQYFNALLLTNAVEPAVYLGKPTDNVLSVKSALHGTIAHNKPKAEREILKGIIRSKEISTRKVVNQRQTTHTKKTSPHQINSKKLFSTVAAQFENKIASIQNQNDLFNTTNPNLNTNLGDLDYLVEEVYENKNYETIEEIIDIPPSMLISPTFEIGFIAISARNNLELQSNYSTVRHDSQVKDLQIPRYAPYFVTADSTNLKETVFELEQVDPYGAGIAIFKKNVAIDTYDVAPAFTLVAQLPLDSFSGKQIWRDVTDTTKPTIYRAVTYNDNNVYGGEFASTTIIKQDKRTRKSNSFARKQSFCSFVYRIVEKTVVLEIRNVSPGPIALNIRKRDLTTHENNYTNVSSNILLTNDPDEIITAEDNNVKNNRIYEYQVELIYQNGTKEIANNNIVVEFEEPNSNLVNVVLGTTEQLVNEEGLDIQIQLQKKILLTDIDVIKGFLKEQGLDEQYADELYKEREGLQNLFFTKVTRFNLTTGEEEDLGMIKTNTFVDSDLRKVKGAKPLQEDNTYRYAFLTYMLDPQAMFDRLVKDVEKTADSVAKKTNETYNRKHYSFSPAKWYHPITLKQGSIVSNQSLTRNHSKTTFTFGKLVDIQYAETSFVKRKPTIINVSARRLDDYSILLTWSLDEEAVKIDHFIISVTISGIKRVIGKCHHADSNDSYYYVDTLDNDEEGALVYSVTPMYSDLSFGPQILSNAIVI